MSSRMRFTVAMFAMLGAMWASIDLHQHIDGLHQSDQCVVCSLEKAATHGFSLHAAIEPVAPWISFPAVNRLARHATQVCTRPASIRAPPSV